MSESKIETELLSFVSIKSKRGETRQDYLEKLMRAVAALKDSEWEKISTPAQEWNNAAAEAIEQRKEIEDFPDVQPEADEEAPQPVKAKPQTDKNQLVNKHNGSTRKISACHKIKQLVVKKPKITVADLAEALQADGFKVSDVTISTLRSDTRDTLRVLRDAGMLEVDI